MNGLSQYVTLERHFMVVMTSKLVNNSLAPFTVTGCVDLKLVECDTNLHIVWSIVKKKLQTIKNNQ